MACVDVSELPLQILLGRAPTWRGLPVAVVDEDRPQGRILWSNAAARALGVWPGMRYASALSLSRELRASVVPAVATGAAVATLSRVLRRFTPNVEPSVDEPGVFWLDASGLGRLYPTLDGWAAEVLEGLRAEGFEAAVAVGFTRFGSYAAVKGLSSERRRVVFDRPEDERATAGEVPLHRLALSARVRERLERLGVRTVSDLVALPPAGVRKRYGAEAHALHQLARGDLFDPLVPVQEEAPAAARVDLDLPEHDAHRLLFRIKRLLDTVVPVVAERQAVIAELRLRLVVDGGAGPPRDQRHRFRPAAPTLDTSLLLDLVRLRLETIDLSAGVLELHLSAREVPATADQLRLFALAPRRDQAAAERALARIRAELGDGAVGVFTLRDGHLPKARASFGPLARLPPPSPREDSDDAPPRRLIRRILPRPVPLPTAPRSLRHDGWQPRDPQQGAIVAVDGPFVISGGWWGRAEVHREYAFARTLRGDILWVFYDRKRRRWYEQGRVE